MTSVLFPLQFFQRVEEWVDDCMVKESPTEIPQAEEMLQKHIQLKETYQELYAMVRRDGHRLIEKLRKPVGESRLVAAAVLFVKF